MSEPCVVGRERKPRKHGHAARESYVSPYSALRPLPHPTIAGCFVRPVEDTAFCPACVPSEFPESLSDTRQRRNLVYIQTVWRLAGWLGMACCSPAENSWAVARRCYVPGHWSRLSCRMFCCAHALTSVLQCLAAAAIVGLFIIRCVRLAQKQ